MKLQQTDSPPGNAGTSGVSPAPHVAQTWSLLHRRFVTRGPVADPGAVELRDASPIENRRYSRLTICAAIERYHRAVPAWLTAALCGLLSIAAWPASAQDEPFVNARVESRPAPSGLEKQFRQWVTDQAEPAWIGYSVPLVPGNHHICCTSNEDRHKPGILRRGRCRLEGRDDGMNFQTNDGDNADAAAPGRLVVLFRAADRAVGRIRVFTDDCELDAGGLSVLWLTEVRPAESVSLLESFVGGPGAADRAEHRKSESAIAAIALHAEAGADAVLERFTDAQRPEQVRKDTAFWLGNVRGRRGYEVLSRLVRQDPSDKVREQCVFALHISKVPEALAALIDLARHDKSSHVRGQALFWLAQKAGEKAVKAITDAIENDPETEVKKKAVFALSQLPKHEGVPQLIDVARKNRNREVRKDAMFWLGQSNDERALAFFEEVLTR